VQIRDRTTLTDDLDDIQYVDLKNGIDDAEGIAYLSGAVRLQLTLVARKRPLWQPATSKPDTAAETSRPANASDVDTPTLRLQLPVSANKGRLSKNLRDVLIGLFVTVLGGVVLFLLQPIFQPKELLPISTSVSQGNIPIATTVIPTQTIQVPDSTATSQPTETDAPLTQTSIPPTLSPEQLALTPVTTNTDWNPIERNFKSVAMVLVPAGCFMMGPEMPREGYEELMHKQCLEMPFWIDKYEVTNAQFKAFNGVAFSASQWTGDNRPRELISWAEARDFCAARGSRLPTEREWEYAARGPDNLEYPWGREWNGNNAVWSGNSNGQTANVRSHPAGVSWVGAMDLSGNVWEWMSSLSQAYPYVAEDGREDYFNTLYIRVLRGGSWNYDSAQLTSFLRWNNTALSTNDIGFRCARDI